MSDTIQDNELFELITLMEEEISALMVLRRLCSHLPDDDNGCCIDYILNAMCKHIVVLNEAFYKAHASMWN